VSYGLHIRAILGKCLLPEIWPNVVETEGRFNVNNQTRLGVGAFVSLLLPAAAVYTWRGTWWPLVLFVGWTVAAAALYVHADRRKFREQNIRMLEHARQSAIRTLSHHRHDWMNDLQILYGYLRLKKPDKAVEIVDRIRERMENDSKISGLGSAELSTFLLSFRTLCDHVRLDFKVAEGLQLDRMPFDVEKLSGVLIGIINAVRYRAVSPASGENLLHITLFQNNGALCLELVFEGELAAGSSLAEDLEKLVAGLGQLTEEEQRGIREGPSRKVLVTFALTA
jgi:stage 0 sporulation protein B (sporulation initiation phosphotransferase)